MPEGVVHVTGALYALFAASSSKSSGSGSSTFIIFLVLIAVVGYFLLIRPQKQKQRRQRAQQSAVAVGDEVLTVGGIVGRVLAVDADRVTILTGGETVGFPAAGNEPTRLVLVRNAISRKLEPPSPDSPDDLHDELGQVGGGSEAVDGHLNGHSGTIDARSPDTPESESEGTSP
ncbi:MAG: preprotein translocase subunit YajC [Acidimicrobiales bacterium]